MEKRRSDNFMLGLFISLGIIISAVVLSNALFRIKASERLVNVKGLAEREVAADLVIWPIAFKESSNILKNLHRELNRKQEIVFNYLVNRGFENSEISIASPQIKDLHATEYVNPEMLKRNRYLGTVVVTVRTSEVNKARKAMQKANELLDKGIVLAGDNYNYQTEYLFTKLNEIKPIMIEEATKNARAAAEKFAQDSGSEVGKIKRAYQGLFSIRNRDRNTPEIKIVRVVTTVDYFLDD